MLEISRAVRVLLLTLLAGVLCACGAPQQSAAPTPLAAAGAPLPTAAPATPAPPATLLPAATAAPATPAQPTASPNAPPGAAFEDNAALARYLAQQVADGAPVVEVDAPAEPLPEDVHSEQVKKYFQVGALTLGLALQPSQNVPLSLPQTFSPSFTGLLARSADGPWRKYLAIRDADSTARNNPYYLWAQDGRMYLSLVDQHGAGSGEGLMTLARLSQAGTWEAAGCYYFGATYRSQEQDGDYFAFSRRLDKQQVAASQCQKIDLAPVP